ncbi:MAG TPA: hypothetical protein VFW06_04745 [Acidimicrobiia bacterium]|nr:hypothetical protein [Acidimicrobiia bacterium]
MPAKPKAGMTYRQEYYAGETEDNGAVVTVGKEKVSVPFGFFEKRVLMTRDTSTIEPKVLELTFFAPGVGPLLGVHLDGPGARVALVSFTEGA